MFRLWSVSIAIAGAVYWLIRRAALPVRLGVVAALLVVPLALTIWLVRIGDKVPNNSIVVVPEAKTTPQ
jgi:hypothetical protein